MPCPAVHKRIKCDNNDQSFLWEGGGGINSPYRQKYIILTVSKFQVNVSDIHSCPHPIFYSLHLNRSICSRWQNKRAHKFYPLVSKYGNIISVN